MSDETRELWRRLESLEDLVDRVAFKVGHPAAVRDFASEDALIAAYRRAFPYKSGDPEHWKRNNSREAA